MVDHLYRVRETHPERKRPSGLEDPRELVVHLGCVEPVRRLGFQDILERQLRVSRAPSVGLTCYDQVYTRVRNPRQLLTLPHHELRLLPRAPASPVRFCKPLCRSYHPLAWIHANDGVEVGDEVERRQAWPASYVDSYARSRDSCACRARPGVRQHGRVELRGIRPAGMVSCGGRWGAG